MSPAAELRLVGIRTQGDEGSPSAATGDQSRPHGTMKQAAGGQGEHVRNMYVIHVNMCVCLCKCVWRRFRVKKSNLWLLYQGGSRRPKQVQVTREGTIAALLAKPIGPPLVVFKGLPKGAQGGLKNPLFGRVFAKIQPQFSWQQIKISENLFLHRMRPPKASGNINFQGKRSSIHGERTAKVGGHFRARTDGRTDGRTNSIFRVKI